ncbi:unnamed protein product [Thlaspi arvense]|uniref:Dienelactone hydrolase domain-containing protein n=1 Tax=Thlaspi arvense TaxID=13288 RepID=A0AAU9RV47_THLAR|nr:unnamed protein product [Thlaspi arvense]
MSVHHRQCTENPPNLDPNSGSGHVEKLGGLDSRRNCLWFHSFKARRCSRLSCFRFVSHFASNETQYSTFVCFKWKLDLLWKSLMDIADKAFEDSRPVVEALKNKGITAIGAVGFCWGAKVAVELAKQELVEAAVLLHPSRVTVDDIKGVKVPISVLGAELDQVSPPELVKQFEDVLDTKPEVKSFVKIFPRVKHGWTVRYNVNDPLEVEAAEEAHKDMLAWLIDHVK